MNSDLEFSVGADTSDFTRGLNTAATDAERFAGQVAGKVGEKIYGLRDVSNVVATALGLNLEVLAENLARWVVGFSKEAEEAAKRVAELGAKTADIYDKISSRRRTDEQNLTELQAQQNALQRESEKIQGDIEKRQQLINIAYERAVEVSKQHAGIFQVQAGERGKAVATAAEDVRLAEIAYEMANKQLSIDELQSKMKSKQSETIRTSLELSAKESDERVKQNQETQKSISLVADLNERRRIGSLPLDQQLVALLEQQKALKLAMGWLDEGSVKWKETAIDLDKTAEEIGRVRLEISENQLKLEKAISDEAERQALVKKKAAAEMGNFAPRIDGRKGQAVQVGTSNYSSISTDVLTADMQQMQRKYQDIVREYQQRGYTGDPKIDNYYLLSEIAAIKEELTFRQSFTDAYTRGGRAGALQTYTAQGRDAITFDTTFANMSSWTKGLDATNQKLDSLTRNVSAISGQLARSGIFPNSN